MPTCDVCGKGPHSGNNVSHSHRKTKRVWQPNIKNTTLMMNGVWRSAKVCTRCLRTLAKAVAPA
ncbi:MAG: 50S ribosomal protein L28 [Dehalococcoidia bacterium]|nr:50S ribosomal protein L28 [Dehalococcoidia bacterium]